MIPNTASAGIPPRNMKEIVTIKQPLDEGTRKWQLSPTDIIEEIRQRLRGCFYNEAKSRWDPISEPVMNEMGIGRVSILLNYYINKNNLLGYLEPWQIENMIGVFTAIFSFEIEAHWRIWEMDKEKVWGEANAIADDVMLALTRARYGKESQFIENTEQRHITTIEGDRGQQGQPGLLSRIPIIGAMRR